MVALINEELERGTGTPPFLPCIVALFFQWKDVHCSVIYNGKYADDTPGYIAESQNDSLRLCSNMTSCLHSTCEVKKQETKLFILSIVCLYIDKD